MSGRILPFPSREHPSAVGPSVAPFVRRATELSFLHHRLEAALQGRRQVVLLAGEPGIGKTSLVDAFLGQLQNFSNLLSATGHCVEQYGPGEAYLPLLEALTWLCRGPSGKQRLALLLWRESCRSSAGSRCGDSLREAGHVQYRWGNSHQLPVSI